MLLVKDTVDTLLHGLCSTELAELQVRHSIKIEYRAALRSGIRVHTGSVGSIDQVHLIG